MARGTLTRVVFLMILGIGHWMARPAHAGPIVTWTNDHSYEAVFMDNPTWFEARDTAASMTLNGVDGYLATFVTRDEQEFVIDALAGEVGGVAGLNALWLGGYQDTSDPGYSERYGGWKWITGEEWLGVAPDDPIVPRADYGFNNTYFDFSTEEYTITWWWTGGINDYYHSPSDILSDEYGGPARGFIVEFDDPVSVPEPQTLLLLGSGLVGAVAMNRPRARRTGRATDRLSTSPWVAKIADRV